MTVRQAIVMIPGMRGAGRGVREVAVTRAQLHPFGIPISGRRS